MDGQIRIITLTEGRQTVFAARAQFTIAAQSAYVSYLQEGEGVTLELFPDEFRMRREGRLQADFVRDSETAFRLILGENEGVISVFTRFYTAVFAEDSIRAELLYTLDFGNNLQDFHLKIFIQSISEAL